jgi:hypothetical protein
MFTQARSDLLLKYVLFFTFIFKPNKNGVFLLFFYLI